MSSFDYTDNFNGFNDLFNRVDLLNEAKKSPYEKYHPSFGGVTKDLRSAGFSSAPLDTINFIRTALYNLELISDEELAAAKKGAGFAAKKKNLLALLDAKEDVIEANKDKIAEEIKDGLARYINRATVDRGKEEKYAAQKAALELAKDIKAGEDMGDAVEDAVGQMSEGEKELAQSIEIAKTDPTTFIEIKIRDADKIEEVGSIVTKYANEDGLDISGDTVQFSVDPDTPLAAAVTEYGVDRIETALKRDVDAISDSVVVVMSPEEDYEQDLYGTEGAESYAANEEGNGITEVEDAEDLSAKKARAGKDIGKPGKNFSKIAKSAGKKYGSKAAGERVAGAVLAKMRGNYEGAEDEFDPDEAHHYPGYDPDRPLTAEQEKRRQEVNAEFKEFLRTNPEIEDNEFDDFLTHEHPEEHMPDDYEEVLDALVDDDKKKHAMKKLNGEDEEELQVENTTAAYLTEQKESDKRNKKTVVKNQSFKERYEPKTSWQLEELRKYGL
tara:strand:+ start:2182 stop:3675 length:1494 start_codon:yes stop_codon:yes gene_type:complete